MRNDARDTSKASVRSRKATRVLVWGLTALCALVIAYGTLKPPDPTRTGVPLNDKLAHGIAFCALCLPAIWFAPRSALWVVPLAWAYGGAIEIVQPFVGRTGEWADLAADIAGSVAGIPLALAFRRLWPPGSGHNRPPG